MSKCDIEIRFDRDDRTYEPNDQIIGEVLVTPNADVSCKKLTIELYWETHGFGDTERVTIDQSKEHPPPWSQGQRYRFPFRFTAPKIPLTYHGHLLYVDHYVKAIVDLLLVRVRDQLESQALDLVLTDDAKAVLAKKGYDPQLGARPLRRAIQRLLEDPLSEKVLFKEFPAGSTILVTVDEEDGKKLAFEAIETPAEPPVELAEN